FLVGNGHGYRARDIAIEPDASTASYFAAAAAVAGGRVTVEHLPMEGSLQGDTRFLRVLEEMGCRLTQAGSSTTVEGPGPGSLRGVTVDMGDFSDTMMTLACVAPFADSPTTITNIAHVRGKESDRVHSVAAGLEAMGVRVAETESTITVYPAKPHGATIDTFGDHRIAMAFSVMGLVTPGVVIDDYRCVDKTCPEFFELFEDMVAQG
ncbi:MAG: 3-phosphoshikimate 1-carboxyvinyltransferase, partial [Chloroflexota bacterium]|nr:3-phosphoshikimate 1-carboxyvinyltransferase [Chloroflexota bacterium]